MKITFFQVSIECEASELSDAIQALRDIASIAPSAPATVSAPSVRALPPSAPCDALRELLREKGIGFKFRPDGKDKGKTLEQALKLACDQAGCDADAIASAMASAPLGDALDGLTVPDATSADDGSELV